ncbi:reverse transcriptase domain-containing protein [Hyphomonas sp.]|uniref:reverse transcriptase domain-containing protein n=1 Tax=Hyphomonas sp. TaxID=87 RepID=UPI003241D8E5
MSTWVPSKEDLKQYRHFDHQIPLHEIAPLVRDEQKVAAHPFMPFLHFEKKWRRAPLKKKDGTLVHRDPKKRKIRYACRKDAYIFKHYRELLSEKYEAQLTTFALSECVLAYRRIPKSGSSAGHKSNIEFAKEAFEEIERLGKCCAVAIDISDFFGSMSHDRIKSVWARLLECGDLPDDHYAVFKALTRYRWVDREKAYLALGYSKRDSEGKLRYTLNPEDIPIQICSNEQFRNSIVGRKLVKKNNEPFGIPQGAPLSDLIANAYLLDFDLKMQKFAASKGGKYYRYSDDILFVLPGDGRTARAAFSRAVKAIKTMGAQLEIKAEKTDICCYSGADSGHRCRSFKIDPSSSKLVQTSIDEGLSYLGFRYDGKNTYLRNSTISNLTGKMYRSCQAVALNHVDRHMDKDLPWLLDNAPLEELSTRFFQVEDFDDTVSTARASGASPYRKMTFFTYASRASEAYGDRGKMIAKQTAKLKRQLSKMLNRQIVAKFQTRADRLKHKRTARAKTATI